MRKLGSVLSITVSNRLTNPWKWSARSISGSSEDDRPLAIVGLSSRWIRKFASPLSLLFSLLSFPSLFMLQMLWFDRVMPPNDINEKTANGFLELTKDVKVGVNPAKKLSFAVQPPRGGAMIWTVPDEASRDDWVDSLHKLTSGAKVRFDFVFVCHSFSSRLNRRSKNLKFSEYLWMN